MGRIHLVGGEKGGVGKSVVARLLAQLLVDHGTRWVGFDTDRSHGSFARCYADYVQRIDVDRATQIDLSVEALAAGADEVVVDLAGQSEKHLWRWMEVGQVLEFMDRLRHELWFWYVIDDSRDSVLLLRSLVERLGGRAKIVCVLNHARGRDFGLFDLSKLRDRIKQADGVVLDLPSLEPAAMHKIESYDKSFWAAVHNEDPTQGPCLSLMERQRAEVFVQGVHSKFRSCLFEPMSHGT